MTERFTKWLNGDLDVMDHILDETTEQDLSRQERKEKQDREFESFSRNPEVAAVIERERKAFGKMYLTAAILSCIALISVLLYVVSSLSQYGVENPLTLEMISRYIEHGLEETGAVNIVSGLILDYRAFDTLGESHVLFTALICVMVLLRIDSKNMRSDVEDYYTIRQDRYFDLSGDSIIRTVGSLLVPSVLLFGVYVILNGQISPGGGFSGGAVMGAGMILFSVAFGFDRTDRFFTVKVSSWLSFCALAFYALAKGYAFFMGANGYETHIPKGTPGAILSGGLILPLDIAVGLVVGCTMFGIFSLFRRGSVGKDASDH